MDLQGFQYRGSPFIPKEISMLSCKTGKHLVHLHISPPVPFELVDYYFQEQIKWTSNKLHGMHYNHGEVSYLKAPVVLTLALLEADIKYIIVKGEMKKDVVKHMLPFVEVINAENYACPSLRTLVKEHYVKCACPHHLYGGNHHCAKMTVKSLYKWLMENVK